MMTPPPARVDAALEWVYVVGFSVVVGVVLAVAGSFIVAQFVLWMRS